MSLSQFLAVHADDDFAAVVDVVMVAMAIQTDGVIDSFVIFGLNVHRLANVMHTFAMAEVLLYQELLLLDSMMMWL
jgi:hypothetical protein